MANKNEPCAICEDYIKGIKCENDKCPVAKMKAENKRLKKRVDALKLELHIVQILLLLEIGMKWEAKNGD